MSDFKTIGQYSGTICFCCRSRGKVEVCGRCLRVSYCSRKCQTADWSFHGSFCLAWSHAIAAFPLSSHAVLTAFPPSKEDLDKIMADVNTHLMKPIRKRLGLDAGKVAVGLAFRLPRCLKCLAIKPNSTAGSSPFETCSQCSVLWCAAGSCRVVKEEHERDGLCSALKVNAWDDNHLQDHESNPELIPSTVWIPPRIVRVETPLPASWIDYFKSVKIPEYINPSKKRFFVQHALSIPLTIVAALEKFGLLTKFSNARDPRTLTIHLIGAEQEYELEYGPAVLEEVTHLLPGVRDLVVVMIGSRLSAGKVDSLPVTRCAECQRRRRTRRVEVIPTDYHDFFRSNPLSSSPPDLALALNSGVCEYIVLWKPIVLYLSVSGAPVVFPSLNQVEAAADEQAVRKLGLDAGEVVWSAQKSPFPSNRKRFDLFSPDYFWSENMYWFGWKGNSL